MARKLCTKCGLDEKRKGHPTSCEECYLADQPIEVQIRAADWRLLNVPVELRAARMPKVDRDRMAAVGRRWCSGCQTWVRLADCGTASQCRPCRSRTAHRGHVAKTYGLGPGDYEALLARQGGRCFLCGRRPVNRRLAVDHDHVTGLVRGLLCGGTDQAISCNYMVVGTVESIAQDSPVAMARRLLAYLEGQTPAAQLWGEEVPRAA